MSRLEPGPLDPVTSALTLRPPRLPTQFEETLLRAITEHTETSS